MACYLVTHYRIGPSLCLASLDPASLSTLPLFTLPLSALLLSNQPHSALPLSILLICALPLSTLPLLLASLCQLSLLLSLARHIDNSNCILGGKTCGLHSMQSSTAVLLNNIYFTAPTHTLCWTCVAAHTAKGQIPECSVVFEGRVSVTGIDAVLKKTYDHSQPL